MVKIIESLLMGELELDRRNTDYWTHLILPTETEIGMSKGTKNYSKKWSLLVKLNQRNHRTGNETWKGRSLSEEAKKFWLQNLSFQKIYYVLRFSTAIDVTGPPPSFPNPVYIQGLRELVVDFLQLQIPWQTFCSIEGQKR